jgi:hypothetical protein
LRNLKECVDVTQRLAAGEQTSGKRSVQNMDQHGSKTIRRYLTGALLALVLWIALTTTFAVLETRSFLQQRGSAACLVQLAIILAVYTAGIFYWANGRFEHWLAGQGVVLASGLLSALAETTGIVLENVTPQIFRYASVSISLMLITFLLWGVAAVWTCAPSAPWKFGLAAAVGSAGICMLIVVAVGFPIELFLRPPDPSVVALWNEYQRSGWSNARLFAVANTLDSGSTHLMLAPFVACAFGGAGLMLQRIVRRYQKKERTIGKS